MRTRCRATIDDLRQAIDCLPRHTRIAMLEGIAANDIIVGAYATGDGICPMLAAHRNGGRTSLIAFAQAWDRVAFRGQKAGRAGSVSRRATERELLILRSHLQASLLDDDVPVGGLAAARRAHEALVARRDDAAPPARRARPALSERPGEPDRTAELQHRSGWAWTRLVRRYDDYQQLMRRLQQPNPAAPRPPSRAPGR
ncbi:MAG TPA: hypothetical protein VHW96_21565 [Solirubrobacteraceae bacterium]|jgi:hypothetical protein|nr:hypothetical protein [Solirubrobacteraceae bacterium]